VLLKLAKGLFLMPTDSIPAKRSRLRWTAIGLMILGVLGSSYGAFEYTRWQPGTDAEAARKARGGESAAEAHRAVAINLSSEERALYIKRIQAVLKQSRCYDGALNGNSDEAQKGLDRYLSNARKKGREPPPRIELPKATASDFDSWLRDADALKGDICAPASKPRIKPSVRPDHTPPRARQTSTPKESYPSLEDW
jgi:hypothetical protein